VSKENGFLQLRRGIWNHVRDGSLTAVAALAYIFMLSEADTRSGIWKGSAQCIATALRIPKSTAKYVLKCLDGRYIRRFSAPGRHSCYPILLHRFVITQGQHVGLMLDAINSGNEKELEFFEREEFPASSPELVQQVGPQRRIENREERKKQAGKPPADPRFGPFLELAKASFETKHGHPPTWDCFGKDGKELTAFLRRAPHVTFEVWQTHISSFFDSTEPFTVKQGGSLSYFVRRFDTFADGPISATLQKGTNGKPTATDLAMQNARALGLDGRLN
jgi:hypothetical protein